MVRLKRSRFNLAFPDPAGDGYVFFNALTGGLGVFSSAEHEVYLRDGYTQPGHGGLASRLAAIGCLVPADRNEQRLLRAYYGRFVKPFQFTVEMSRSCNFVCPYCYQNGTHEPGKVISPGVLDACVRYASRVLTEGDVREFELNVIGGEPLLHPDRILHLLHGLADALSGRPEIRWRVTLDTNGALLTDRFLSRCRRTTFSISLSPPEDHNRKRPFRGGRPSYHVIEDNILGNARHFDRDSNLLLVRYNLDHENSPLVLDFLRRVAAWPIKNRSFMVVNVVNYAFNEHYTNKLTDADCARQCGAVLDEMVRLDVPVRILPYGVITPCHVFTPYSCKVFYDGGVSGCDIADQRGPSTIFDLLESPGAVRPESANPLTHKLCLGDSKICNLQVYPLQQYLASYVRALRQGKADRLFPDFCEHARAVQRDLATVVLEGTTEPEPWQAGQTTARYPLSVIAGQ
jgi:hypothetical protein